MFNRQINDIKNKQEARSVFFQPKLTINQPNDVYEQEADNMADKVMRMTDNSQNQNTFFKPANVSQPALQRQTAPPPVVPVSTTVFHPGIIHSHTPSGRWADIQANPNSGFQEGLACRTFQPAGVVQAAIATQFSGKPIALAHLNWYLSAGGGADFNENSNIDLMLRTDTGVQGLIAALIPTPPPAGGTITRFLRVDQTDYTSQDLRFAFGSIDRLDFAVDFAAGTVHAWFQDRYEWHPFYPGIYTSFPDDSPARPTNCVHAALVELQSGTARDYWMKGEATVPLSLFLPAAAPGGGGAHY